MTEFDEKVLDLFPGKVVRKDLTSLMKKGANVPTYVLEYLLGMYCATDDEDAIEIGLGKIKRILSENYVRPDQSEYVKSKIKENGQYTIIDKIIVALKMDSLINDAIKGTILLLVILIQTAGPKIREKLRK